MAANNILPFVQAQAGATIQPATIVSLGTYSSYEAWLPCTASLVPWGVSANTTKHAAGTYSYSAGQTQAADAGDQIGVAGAGQVEYVTSGGTFSIGNPIGSNASGLAVTPTTTGTTYIVGWALDASTASGQLCRIFIVPPGSIYIHA